MKKRIFTIMGIMLVFLSFYACTNESVDIVQEEAIETVDGFVDDSEAADTDNNSNSSTELLGNYTGTFTVEYFFGNTFSDDPADDLVSNPVTVTFGENTTYASTWDVTGYPAGGSGTYERNGDIMTFNDENIWNSSFDGNLILIGEYVITQNGDDVLLVKTQNYAEYTYDLTKE